MQFLTRQFTRLFFNSFIYVHLAFTLPLPLLLPSSLLLLLLCRLVRSLDSGVVVVAMKRRRRARDGSKHMSCLMARSWTSVLRAFSARRRCSGLFSCNGVEWNRLEFDDAIISTHCAHQQPAMDQTAMAPPPATFSLHPCILVFFLYRPKMMGYASAPGIHTLAHRCIQKCPIDMRRALYQNILVTGGSSKFPGTSVNVCMYVCRNE